MEINMLRKALWVFLKPLITLITNLLNPEVGEEWLTELKKFLRKEPCWVVAKKAAETIKQVVKRVFMPQWTIKIGGTTTEKLLNAIEEEKGKKEKNEVSKWASDIMDKPAFKISPNPAEVGLISLTPSDLGFTTNPRTDTFMTKEFCAKWSAENLEGYVIELCEAEDGPRFREQYQNQPIGETLWMSMERIIDSVGRPRLFVVKRRDGGVRYLDTDWVYSDITWVLVNRFVFRLRKISLPSVAPVLAQA
jgi:hypothetical protein